MSNLKQLAIVGLMLLILLAPAIAGSDEVSTQSCPAASTLDVGNSYYGYISSAGEVDWMRWDPDNTGKFTVTLEVPAGHDYDLEVYTVCGTPACRSSNDAGEEEKCTIVNPGSGNVYAKIYGYNGDYSPTAKYYINGVMETPVVDLVAANILPDHYNPTDKDYIGFGYSFTNLGPDDIAGSFDNKFYIDGNEKGSCRISGLRQGTSKVCIAPGIRLNEGSYSLKQKTDASNEVEENDESNNVYTQSIDVSHLAQYDLALSDYYTVPRDVDDKHFFDIVWFVTNRGSDDVATSFKTAISFDGEIRKTCEFSGINVGVSKECRLENQKWTADTHWGSIFVDSERRISETDESNNGNDWNVFVKHIPDVDLSVSAIYTEPSSINEKTAFTLKYNVKNSGSEGIDTPFKSQLYVNSELKGTCDHDSGLGAGQVQSCGVSGQEWPIGEYGVKAAADSGNAITETNENNNELTKPITVADSCPIPDGSSSDCECSLNSDCPSGYYCEFRTGLNACVKVTCNNECDSSGFFCSEGDAYECGNFDTDPCNDKRLADACGVGEVCKEGERSCQIDPSPIEIHAEDADSGTVYKQPGDLIEVTTYSETLQDITFSYPENFTLVTGLCVNGIMAASGRETCLFKISDTVAAGNYYFSAKGKVAKVTITDSPNTMIVTNRQKLRERFPNDPSGVDTLLKQAFQSANAQGNTVVYYLDREFQDHPFASFGDYSESILAPSLESNAYGMTAAEFINAKCGQCKNTIILGDDYVVPFYRVDYATIYNWWQWWVQNKTETSSIYSDQPYIKENTKTVGDLSSLFDSSEHKKVKIVILDAPSAGVQERVEQLKTVVRNEFHYDDNDVSVISSDKIGCNSYGMLDKATLILIGSRDDNNAIKCVPWFDVGKQPTDTFKASIEVERNVWANNEYAIIVSGPDVASGLDNLIAMLNYSDYFEGTALGQKNTVYINEFSNPPDLPPGLAETGSHIVGFALGTCEEGNFAGEKGACIATDMVAGVVPPTDIITDIRDTVLYCPAFIWNKITGKKGELLNGLACGGSAAGTGITIGKYVTAVTGVGAVAGTVADGGSTALKTVLKVTKASLKSGADRMIKVFDKIQLFKFKNAQAFFKAADDESTWKTITKFAKTTSENSKYINKLTEHFPEDVLAATIKNVDDYDNVAVGAKKVLLNVKTFDDAAPGADAVTKAAFVKNVGKIGGKAAEDVAKISDVKGVHKLADNIIKQPVGGFEFEAEMASNLKKGGKELEEVSKKIETKVGDTEVDALLKNGDIYEAKIHDWAKNPPGSNLYTNLKGDLGEKISRFKAFQQANNFAESKITIVFKGSVDTGIEDWLKNTKGVLVEVLP